MVYKKYRQQSDCYLQFTSLSKLVHLLKITMEKSVNHTKKPLGFGNDGVQVENNTSKPAKI